MTVCKSLNITYIYRYVCDIQKLKRYYIVWKNWKILFLDKHSYTSFLLSVFHDVCTKIPRASCSKGFGFGAKVLKSAL